MQRGGRYSNSLWGLGVEMEGMKAKWVAVHSIPGSASSLARPKDGPALDSASAHVEAWCVVLCRQDPRSRMARLPREG
eukprot:1141294-Pelagomonas_calceolata.AAC.2